MIRLLGAVYRRYQVVWLPNATSAVSTRNSDGQDKNDQWREAIHESFDSFIWIVPVGRVGTVHCKSV